MLASVLAGALIASAAALGAAAPANAAEGDVESGSGSLSWGVRESLRNYVGIQLAALPNEGGAAPVGTRIVPSGGATFDAASASASPSNPAETKSYLFPVAGGAVTDADNLTIALGGSVQYWFPSHNFDIHFSDLKVVVDDGTATIVGDIAFSDVSWNGTTWNVAAPTVGNDIAIATVGTAAVSLDAEAGTVSVTGTNVAFTAESAAVFYAPLFGSSLYSEGDPMDDFTLTASYSTGGGETPTTSPSISVSKAQVDPAGDTVIVTGSGFDPTLLGNGAPVSNLPAGFYVVIGSFADDWQLTQGYAGSTRPNIVQKWALPEPPLNSSPSLSGASYTKLNADGTFQVELTIPNFNPASLANGTANFGVYTYPAGTRTGAGTSWTLTPADWEARAPYETFTPLTILGASDVTVTLLDWVEEETGSFGWAFASPTPANLGVAVQEGSNFVATGALTEIVVTDTRAGGTGAYTWSVTGQVGDFTSGAGTFSGSFLGWTPQLIEGGASIAAGAAVTSSQLVGGLGLSAPSVLASSTAAASARLGADLELVIPGTTPAGDYTAKLTITGIQ